MAELGVPRINTVSLDPDRDRTFDQFAALTELAAQRNIRTVVEPVPGLTVGDIPTAVAALQHVGRPDFRLLIDTMHLVRSGSSAADIAGMDPEHIGYVQLNDTTLAPRIDNYMEEAMFERMVPGEGELPLHDTYFRAAARRGGRTRSTATIIGAGRRQPDRSTAALCRSGAAFVGVASGWLCLARFAQRKTGGTVDPVDDGHVLDRIFRCCLDRFAPQHRGGEGVELVGVGGATRESAPLACRRPI